MHECGLTLSDVDAFQAILAALQPTKESIRDAKNWIMDRAAVAGEQLHLHAGLFQPLHIAYDDNV
jgi:hypothetical protein